jgi:hypothetical protein
VNVPRNCGDVRRIERRRETPGARQSALPAKKR